MVASIVLALVPITSAAQDAGQRPIDLSADLVTSVVVDGRRTNELVGNVVLADDSTTLRAERAIEYVDRDLIVFTGNVSIVEERDTLRSDMLRYDRVRKVGSASGSVVLADGEVTVFGPTATYTSEGRHTLFDNGVTMVDSTATLSARVGEYWSREKRALFQLDVTLVDERATTTADSIEYFRETGIAEARGNVTVSDVESAARRDSLTTTWLFADRVRAERSSERSVASGDVLLLRLRADSTGAGVDTLVVRSHRLATHDADSVQVLGAGGDVTVWAGGVAALADSLHSSRRSMAGVSTEFVAFFGDPILWREEAQITGDTIRARLKDGELDSLFVDSRAFMAQEDTTLARIQQVAGRTLRGRFDGGDGEIVVGPAATAVYFLAEEGEERGAMRVAASWITFVFAADSLQSIQSRQDVDGTYFDADIVPPSLGLDGLRWRPADRPTREIFVGDPRARERLVHAAAAALVDD